MQLIPRLYDCDEGEVLVDGVNVKEYSLNHLRDGVAMVLQKNTLFSGSLIDNLRWGNENATLDEIKEACQIACVDEFVDRLADGYDTEMGQEGVNVSGGQKQRAAVARAIITRPSLLLADEPTGALDSRSSDELLRLFGELNRGVQRIVMVTHSVRAASTAWRVLFIKDC